MSNLYRHKCTGCRYPARLDTQVDEVNGIEQFLFCVNPTCFFYDRLDPDLAHQNRLIPKREKAYRKHLDLLLPAKPVATSRQGTSAVPTANTV